MQGFAEFEFDLPSALLGELVQLLDSMESCPLRQEATTKLPEAQGIYQLFLGSELMYVGKTDAQLGLRSRLSRHAKKLGQRNNLEGLVSFRAVRVMVFTTMDLESQLIEHYRKRNGTVSWNGSGFGSNDPGRRRETTNQSPDGFDSQFPINLDSLLTDVPLGVMPVATALRWLKRSLTFTLRYETLRDDKGRAKRNYPHPDLLSTQVTIPSSTLTVRELLLAVGVALGPDWQVTAFPSHIIVYKENHSYEFGVRL